MKRLTPGMMLAVIGMGTAVAVLMLFAAGVCPWAPVSAVCLFTASLMTWVPLREERGYVFALIEYVLVTGVSLLISRQSIYTYLYIALFGHYAVVRFFLLSNLNDRFLTVLIRLLFLNLMAAAGIAFAEYVLGMELETLLPRVSVFILIGVLQGVFLVFMLLYKIFAMLFDSLIRNFLIPKR